MWSFGNLLLAWCGMMVMAIGNGLVRERWLAPRFSPLTAHQCSTLLLLALLTLYSRLLLLIWPPVDQAEAWKIGMSWMLLTLVFECGFGRLVAGRSWRSLLAEYNLKAGRLWILVPAWLLLAPLVLSRF